MRTPTLKRHAEPAAASKYRNDEGGRDDVGRLHLKLVSGESLGGHVGNFDSYAPDGLRHARGYGRAVAQAGGGLRNPG